ncbi:precorrin-6y C5,15-methyltransferase (decarboxylating) subunit CbiE [Prochlorococcus sp. MIT 1300]|uniref:precorrin-6y C5,15-methyltransferase (decarboxylating) subunit CbiE n=1 Tax=Prochlorococcus sp. MIT 1300 TaxID=3096218 RepID=UPI002A75A98F|nr:precorrin-6y C5,15-methyltransferase (decarboxylating) subunit CbiE [Prochlorococcus sp. MIT 1300]
MSKSKDRGKINVIGTDASGLWHLPPELEELVVSAEAIAASKRILQTLPEWWAKKAPKKNIPQTTNTDQPEKLVKWLKQTKGKKIVLASGDPLWFGIGRRLSESFKQKHIVFHPGPSSMQLAFARIGRSWQDCSWISIHGRDATPLIRSLQKHPSKLVVLPDPQAGGAEQVRELLNASGLASCYEFWLFEQLGHPDERVRLLNTSDKIPKGIDPLHLTILIKKENLDEIIDSQLPLFGLKDGLFFQHKDRPGLMTKREMRVQLLAELELPEKGVLWDIGAGVGSVGLEALRLRPQLQLMAVEKRAGGADVILTNAARLKVKPAAVLEVEAVDLITGPNLPRSLKYPNRVLIGGSDKRRLDLLEAISKKIAPDGIIIIPLANIEALSEIKPFLEKNFKEVSISQHQTWRGLPINHGTRLSPINPIIIIKGKHKIFSK